MISNILPIIQGGKYVYSEQQIKHTITKQNIGCHDYQFVGINCLGGQTGSVWAEVTWNPVEYTDEIEQQVNAVGDTWKLYHRKRARLSFNGLCDEDTLNTLHELALQPTVELVPWVNGSPQASHMTFDWQIEANDAIDGIQVAISFAVQDADSVITGCCGTPYDNVPYEPCELPEETDCIGYGLAIAATGTLPTLTLTATPSGTPAGDTETITWYSVGPGGGTTQIGTGTSIVVTTEGTYRAVANSQPTNCYAVSDISVVGDCLALSVTLTEANGVLIAQPSSQQPGGTFTWAYQPAVCPGDPVQSPSVLPDTGAYVVPQGPGTYSVTYSLGEGCDATAQTTIQGCGFYAAEISRAGDQLTALANFICDTPTYAWELDEDNSGVWTALPDTTESITIESNGVYRVTVNGTIPGGTSCAYEATYCVTTLCSANVTIQNLGAQLAANPIDCDGPTYFWEQQLQPGPWEPFDAPGEDNTAPVITPVFAGNYRVTINCTGGCTATADVTWFPPQLTTNINSQLFEATDPAGEFEFTVTNFDLKLLNPGSADNINFRYHVYRNGARVTWMDQFDINTLGNHTYWTYDEPSNVVRVKFDDALYPGDWLLIIDTQGV